MVLKEESHSAKEATAATAVADHAPAAAASQRSYCCLAVESGSKSVAGPVEQPRIETIAS